VNNLELIDAKYQEELVVQLKNGTESAFNEIYKAYSKPIWLRILRLVKDKDVADEILQDVFVSVWKNRHQLAPEKSFKAFIYTIAQNLVFNYFRKNTADNNLVNNLLLNNPHHYLNIDQLMEEAELRRFLDNAVELLSPQRKRAFILCKLEGKSYEEAGKIMGVSVPTINSHITQSLQFLKDYFFKNLKTILLILFWSMDR
jgi:RNA polymerase sigma-70 factor (ECF subfamily)